MRPTPRRARLHGALALLAGAAGATAQPSTPPAKAAPPSIEAKTAGMQKLDGFLPLYWDEAEGRLYLEIARFGVEMLHSNGFASGLGSNDIGIDRGALAGSRIVIVRARRARRCCWCSRTTTSAPAPTNPEEVRAVRDAFARSVLWGFTVAAETGGRVLVDATEWLVRDNLNLAPRLRPGTLQARREAQQPRTAPGTFNFPKNTELEVELTYVLQQPSGPPQGGAAPGPGPDFGGGRYFEGVGDVAASGEAASLRIHHSFVELPDAGYRPRAFDPRVGLLRRSPTRSARRASTSRSSGASSPVTGSRRRTRRRKSSRGQEADRLLPRPGHARADPLGAARRRALVEPGLRGRGLQGRLPRRAAARGRPPARRALQRDQLGAPLDARLEHRRRRSSIRAPARSSRAS